MHMNDERTESAATGAPVGFAASLGRGLVSGVAAGVLWWLIEGAVNWAFGGVIPLRQSLVALGLVLAPGAVGGLAVGAAWGIIAAGGSAASYALGMTVVYGLIRAYEPPGLRAEALFVVRGALCAVLGVRLAGERRGWLGFVHV